MSKKHFEALALALRTIKPTLSPYLVLEQWERDVNAVANVCEANNPAHLIAVDF